jgi:hypothetical protein
MLVGEFAGKMRLAGVIIVLCIGNWNVAVHGLSSSSAASSSAASVVPRPTMPSVLDVGAASLVSPQHWKELHLNGWVEIPDYATNAQVELLKFDAQRLEYGGFVNTAGTGNQNNPNSNKNNKNDDTAETPSSDEKEKPVRMCQHAWLMDEAGSVNSFSGKITKHRTFFGPPYVSECIANLEESLDGMSPYYDATDSMYQNGYNIMPCESEAAYLYYQPGGYYLPHFDTPSRKATTTSRQKKHRRGFSFLLYLGGGATHEGNQQSNKKRMSHKDQSEPWSSEDGGALKMYNPPLPLEDQQKRVSGQGCDPDTTTGFKQIYPVAGSLVVFKSEAICHEVLETHRARLALVGWIHTNIPNTSK